MNTDLINGLAAFAFVTSVTPGPNNLMLMASGAQFGFRRTIPHMLGISIGFCVMAGLVGLGVMQVFAVLPVAEQVLKVLSLTILVWLVWKIATAAPGADMQQTSGTPMSFLGAAAFQWVNPKAWPMALTAVTLFAPDRTLASIGVVAGMFALVNLPSVGIWAYAGEKVRLILTSPARQRAFNLVMAALLAASVVPLLR